MGYGAILFRHVSASGFNGQYPGIIWTVVLSLAIFFGTTVFISFEKKDK